MAQTKFQFEGFAPFTNDSRLSEFARAIAAVFEAHRVTGFFTTQTGPYPDGFTDKGFTNGPNSRPAAAAPAGGARDDQRSERARAAAEDFGGPEDEPDPLAGSEPVEVRGPNLAGDRRDGQPADGEPGRQRRKRSDAGKPRGPRGAASGSAAEGRSDDDQRTEGRDASGRDGNGRAAQGSRAGVGEGEGADGRSGRGGGRPGRSDDRDAEAPAVSSAADDFADDWNTREPAVDPADFRTGEDDGVNGEEWCAKSPGDWPDSLTPEKVDRTTLSGLMSDHYRAHGGKFRAVTFDLLFEACQAQDIASVPEKDLRRVAKVFLKDTARYKFGIKPQPTKAPA